MKHDEAIKGLKNLFSEHELTLPCTDSLEIMNMSVAALGKQIPIKCVKDDCKRDCCPSCGWIIGYGDTIQPYCHNCGQALDWPENPKE